MEPRIEELKEKMLIGKSIKMSLFNNLTGVLWKSFMQERNVIKNGIDSFLYSIQIYDQDYHFQNIDSKKEFTKWAAVEVDSHNNIPINMNKFILPSGLYAVFLHKGSAKETPRTFQYIFGTWLPQSKYSIDKRPHFEKLGEKYQNDSNNSEEEFWIPIAEK